jgi:hypothetical protein
MLHQKSVPIHARATLHGVPSAEGLASAVDARPGPTGGPLLCPSRFLGGEGLLDLPDSHRSLTTGRENDTETLVSQRGSARSPVRQGLER